MTFHSSHSALLLLAAGALTSTALGQCPEQSLRGLDTTNGDEFARSLDATPARLIVGSPKDTVLGVRTGSAYVFRTEQNGLVQEAKLMSNNSALDDRFGFAVAMTGLGALVGAPEGDGFASDSGRVVAFARAGTTWTEVTQLDPGEGDAGDKFGWSIAVDGNRAVIGAPSAETTAGGPDGGAAYVFEFGQGNGWQLVTKLVPSDIHGQPNYGRSVALDGDRIVVGTPFDSDGGTDSGAAYVFDKVGPNWILAVKLIPTDFEAGANFGWSVDVDGNEVMVGARDATGNGLTSGAAYVFSDAGGVWSQDAKLYDPLGASGAGFGFSVSMQAGKALVGAPFSRVSGETHGRAYECNRDAGTWGISFSVESPTAGTEKRMGISVVVEGSSRAVGDFALSENFVHIFAMDGPDCNLNGIPDSCELVAGTAADDNNNGILDVCENCSIVNLCTSGPNSSGAPATVSTTGSVSVNANDLVLTAGPVPNQPGLFFYGPASASVPFGNGMLCIAGPFQRLPVALASNNTISTLLDNTSPPTGFGQITPGSTWYFQCWFRDPQAGGAFFDLSDGLRVRFCP